MNSRINYLMFFLICLAFFFLETTFFSKVFIIPYISFLAIIIISAGIVNCSNNFFYSVFILGFLIDIYSASNFGNYMFSFVVLAFFVCTIKEKILKKDDFLRTLFVIFLSILFYNLIQILIIYPYFLEDYPKYDFFIKKITFDVIIGVPLSVILTRLIKRKKDESILYKKEK